MGPQWRLSLERLAHHSGGESFFIVDESFGDKSLLSTYVALTDAFREVQRRTLRDSPALVMEKRYGPHREGVYEEHGHFVIDKFSGGHTQFQVFALNPFGNFLKSINIQDKRGNIFNNIMDNMANYHIFSIYNVPFSSEQNIGMNWSYSLERLPSHNNLNNHVIQVTSGPRQVNEKISIRLWTNLEAHAVVVSPEHPVVLYAEVRLGNSPVVDASVTAVIQAINQSGFIAPPIKISLMDNGNGDPDMQSHDGIYSRYLTQFPGGEGRYTVKLVITDNYGKAFSPMKTYPDESRSCCRDKAYAKIANQKLGTFSRIVSGDSFRISKIMAGPLPPARVMNLMVDVHTASHQLEFSWTSPGEDLDSGKPTSYQLFYSDTPAAFFTDLNKAKMIESFSAAKSAGGRETHKISVSLFNSNLHYAILAVDSEGNLGEVSNVVKAYMPRPVLPGSDITTSAHSGNDLTTGSVVPAEQPNKIILYLIVGIVGFIVLCIFVILIILISFRRRKHMPDDEVNAEVGVSTDKNLTNNGFSEDMDSTSRDPESKRFLLGNSGNSDSLGPGPIHSSTRDESGSVSSNPYGYIPAQHNNSYGWSATANPYVYKDNNETYASIASFHNSSQDSYIRGFNPTYAQPIPKSMRPHHIYSNAAVIARHSPQSSISHQTSAEISRGTVTFQSNNDTPPLRVSPDSQSSENAPTPTKSILKKPKGPGDLTTSLDITDRESQSSQASAASCSSSQKLDDGGARSPSATDTVSSQQSAMSTVTMDDINLSIEKTYLETSFEFSPLPVGCQLGHKPTPSNQPPSGDTPTHPKQPPPTLPKPKLGLVGSQDALNGDSNLSSLDKKIRNCTQV